MCKGILTYKAYPMAHLKDKDIYDFLTFFLVTIHCSGADTLEPLRPKWNFYKNPMKNIAVSLISAYM